MKNEYNITFDEFTEVMILIYKNKNDNEILQKVFNKLSPKYSEILENNIKKK